MWKWTERKSTLEENKRQDVQSMRERGREFLITCVKGVSRKKERHINKQTHKRGKEKIKSDEKA